MQQITTREWTEITGLDASKTYVLQAQIPENKQILANNTGNKPTEVMWKQSATEPQSSDVGEIDNKLKASAAVKIWVKSPVDCLVVVQEVI